MLKKLLLGVPLVVLILYLTWNVLLSGVRGSEQDAVTAESDANQLESQAVAGYVAIDTSAYDELKEQYDLFPLAPRWGDPSVAATEEKAQRWLLDWASKQLKECMKITDLTLSVSSPMYAENGDWFTVSVSVEIPPIDRESARLFFADLRKQAISQNGMRLTSFEWGSLSSEIRPLDPEDNNATEGDEAAQSDDFFWDCASGEAKGATDLLPGQKTYPCRLHGVIDDPDRAQLRALRPERFTSIELQRPSRPSPRIELEDENETEVDEDAVAEDWACVSLKWSYEQVIRFEDERSEQEGESDQDDG